MAGLMVAAIRTGDPLNRVRRIAVLLLVDDF
jgi:hypothetical protein